jgi:D-serine deaminase-like pyridoxal phosphate-dependent protein
MERPVFKPVGTSVEELDTPALVVDLDVLQSNIETLHSFFRDRDAKVRPHVESHRCPAIAHKQLAAGGTVGGVSVTTVGQAEVFSQSGFDDIFIASEVVTGRKIDRACAVARDCRIMLACDNPDNVRDLSEGAGAHGVDLGVVVDIHTRLERCGVEPGRPAVDLARAIAGSPNLTFKGLMTYEGVIDTSGPEENAAESRRCIQQVLDTREMVEQEGIDVAVVSVGGTHNYEIAGEMSGVTEVPAGSYALMDAGYRQSRPQFATAARVLGTVISRPEPGLAWLDVGQKAIGIDSGLPAVDGLDGVTVMSMSAEHGGLTLESEAGEALALGDKVWLTPRDIGSCVNVYDYINGVRNGRLEVVWDVEARGRYR